MKKTELTTLAVVEVVSVTPDPRPEDPRLLLDWQRRNAPIQLAAVPIVERAQN